MKPGFRSYLNISAFTNLSQEVLEAILDNLADNTANSTLQIVLGAVNLAKVSETKKNEAIAKNYTLS